MKYFNETKWEQLIKKPDWYLKILPEVEELRKRAEQVGKEEKEAIKQEVYGFFEKHLITYDIALGSGEDDLDTERKPIDMIVIHHTSNSPGMNKDRLSAIELIRLYAPYFNGPYQRSEKHLEGKLIYSGHVRNGRQVFWPYHWLVRKNGSVERLLEDNEIGWQAGNWDVNCRSIAIVLDNDYETSRPSDSELAAIASLIKSRYSGVLKERIFGHCEIKTTTVCPSQLFLSKEGQKGWKQDLLNLL